VASQVLARSLWIAAAAVAAGVLGALAFQGERPTTHMGAFVAGGVMRHITPSDVKEVEVATRTQRWHFTRTPSGWVSSADMRAPGEKTRAAIEQGLLLLHNSAPERTLAGGAKSDAYGLEAPVMTITAKGRESFSIVFGGTNPLGLARYARVGNGQDVVLLPRFVADAWQGVVGQQAE